MTTESAPAVLTVDDHSRGIVSTSAILLGRRVIVTIGAAVATGIITRRLSPDSFGVYSAALATFFLAQAFCDLGFGAVLARELSTRIGERSNLLNAALRPAAAWSFVVALGLAAFALLTSDGLRLHILLVLVPAVALGGASITRQWFVAKYEVRTMGLLDLVTNLAQVVLLILVALLDGDALLLAVVVAACTMANTAVVAVMALRQSGRSAVQSGDVRQFIWMSLPIGIPSILASAYFSVDLVIAGYLVSGPEVARYAAATKLLTLVTVLPSILMSVALVGFSAVNAGGDKHATGALVARSWQWLMVFALPVCVSLIFFAAFACRVFFGAAYASSAEPLRVLMVCGGLALLGNLLGTLLIAARRTAVTMIQNTIVLALNISLNIWLLPRYGIMAAAWITLGTEILSISCALVILRSTLSWKPSLLVSRVPLLASAVLAGASFLPIQNDFLRAALAGTAFLVVMTVLRGWPFRPTDLVRRLSRRVAPRRGSRP